VGRRAGDEDLDVFRITDPTYPTFPSIHILDLIEKEVFMPTHRVWKGLVPAPYDQVQVFHLYGIESVIFKVKVNNLPAVYTLRCKAANGIEEEEGLPRSPDTGKPDNLTRSDGEDQLPYSAGWKTPIRELTEYILKVVAYHRYNLSNVIPPCKDNNA
jgi:hypothetical protein